jgi:hypothetical protein
MMQILRRIRDGWRRFCEMSPLDNEPLPERMSEEDYADFQRARLQLWWGMQ